MNVDFWKSVAIIVAGVPAIFIVNRLFVGPVIDAVAPWCLVKPPAGSDPHAWRDAVSGVSAAGKWIGFFESVAAYLSLLHSSEVAGFFVAGWLAFKVASKWEVWSNIVRVPDALEGVDRLELIRARRAWGDILNTRFLVGTLLNLLIGGVTAAFVARILQ